MTDDEKSRVDRINQVSAMARTSWTALLGYLALNANVGPISLPLRSTSGRIKPS